MLKSNYFPIFINRMNTTKNIKAKPKKQNNKNKIINTHIDLNKAHYLSLNDDDNEEE